MTPIFLGLMKRKTFNREVITILLLLIFKLRVRDDDVEIIWSARNRSEVTLTLFLKIGNWEVATIIGFKLRGCKTT